MGVANTGRADAKDALMMVLFVMKEVLIKVMMIPIMTGIFFCLVAGFGVYR